MQPADWPVPWPVDLPAARLRQPDAVSCGAATVVAVRALLDPAWRPADPTAEIIATHRGLTGPVGAGGRAQLPWPRRLGTPPWALSRALEDLTGHDVDTRFARLRPWSAYDDLRTRLGTRPVGVYVGNAWLPRHVVLAVAAGARGVTVFDPARGSLVEVGTDRWGEHRVGVAGWSHFWAVV